MPKYLYYFLILLAIAKNSVAQKRFFIKHLDNESGLSNNTVNSIFQDFDKLIWLSTSDGLDVYSGNSFQKFKTYYKNTDFSLLNNVVRSVAEDSRHNVWISTEEGITRYNKGNGKLSHYFYGKDKKNFHSADYLLSVNKGTEILSCLRQDRSLYRYNQSADTFSIIQLKGVRKHGIAKIEFDTYGKLWVLYMDGVIHCFKNNGFAYQHVSGCTHSSGINNFHIVNNRVFFVVGTGLYEISNDFTVHKIISIPHIIKSMTFYQGSYYIAWHYGGVQEYDRNFVATRNLLPDFPALKDLDVNAFHISDNDHLWIGTENQGTYQIRPNKNTYGQVNMIPGIENPLGKIQAFAQFGESLFIGTQRHGVLKMNIRDVGGKVNQLQRIPSAYENGGNSIFSLVSDERLLYIGSDALGLTLYEPKGDKLVLWQDIEGTEKYLDIRAVHSILRDPDGSIFFGWDNGLVKVRLIKKSNGAYKLLELKRYKNSANFLSNGNNVIWTMADLGTNLLVGYRYGGLSLLNKKTGKFKDFPVNSYPGSLTNSNILSIFRNSDSGIWIGTSNGLFLTEIKQLSKLKPVFKHYRLENGLPDNTVHSIVADTSGDLWLSTNNGIAKISMTNKNIIQLKSHEAIQNKEFSDNAAMISGDGRLFFGGISGFNNFYPSEISVQKKIPNLLVSDLDFAGKSSEGIQLQVIKPEGSGKPKEYVFPRKEDYFSLKLQTIEFNSSDKGQFRYELRGYDSHWHYTVGDSKINYSNLPPGKYSLIVKWSNGDGLWTAEQNVFNIRIKQYFWLSWVAYILYFLIALAIGGWLYVLRKRQAATNMQLYLEGQIRKKESKLNQEKLDFFTNIAHELLTPLTLVNGSIERFFLRKDQKKWMQENLHFLNIASQESFRLQYLVSQLLEFRKAESGHIANNMSAFNASVFFDNIGRLFEPVIEQKQQQWKCEIQPEINMYSDKDKTEKIIFNLLSNATKYTDVNEKIVFRVHTGQDNVMIEVRNSGYFNTLTDLSVLFEQFYTVMNGSRSKISSGIGLALTKQLTVMLGGEINVSSQDGWIIFNVVLPLNSIYLGDTEAILYQDSEQPSLYLSAVVGEANGAQMDIKTVNNISLIENLENNEKKSILLVEDEVNIRYLLRESLSDSYIIYEAESGEAAIELLKAISPSLILSDVLMGEMSGLDLCKNVKNRIETCHIPFALLSAMVESEHKVLGFEAGADAYITKPYDINSLKSKLVQLIKYRENIETLLKAGPYNDIATGNLNKTDKDFLDGLFAIIKDNISDAQLDAGFIESKLSVSKMTLYRKIKELANMTPSEFIRYMRLKHAAHQLQITDLTVSEVYYNSGFNNQSYFYREFKRLYKYSPKEFRERSHAKGKNLNELE
ncbi:MAG: helix-turn-helix domain-containing protein [Chryseobacterium sp.]|nr:MAG: helix-turn-helix domain-containing protein [Chryseobacterium sp.]